MANTYHQIYIQAVFGVKYRAAVIEKEWEKNLYAAIGNFINETGCKTLLINGVYDHVHCFFGLKPTIAVSELMKAIKSKSSKHINDEHLTHHRFEWQDGYGAFSYSYSQKDAVFKYVQNQAEHHKKQTFREEYLNFLEKFNVPYDERYIFDDLQ